MTAGYDSVEDYERDMYGLHSDSEEESEHDIEQELYQQIHYGQEDNIIHHGDAADVKNEYTMKDKSIDKDARDGWLPESSKNDDRTAEEKIFENDLNSDREEESARMEDSVVFMKVVSQKRKTDVPCISLVTSDSESVDSDESSVSLTPPPAKKLKTDKPATNQSELRTGNRTDEVNQSNRGILRKHEAANQSKSGDEKFIDVLSSDESEPEWTVIDEVNDSSDEGIQTNVIGASFRYANENRDSNTSDKLQSKELWTIDPEDLMNNVQNSEGRRRMHTTSKRYYTSKSTIRCLNCGNAGHLSKSCPSPKKATVCFLCAGKGHIGWKCPNQICTICDSTGHHHKQCYQKPWPKLSSVCPRCNVNGHTSKTCPDRWRQFYATTEPGEIKKMATLKNKKSYCYNCAKRGHLGHQCDRPRMEKLYFPATPFVCKYDTWIDVENRFEQLRKNQENRNIQTKDRAQTRELEKERPRNNHIYFKYTDEDDSHKRGKKRKRDDIYNDRQNGKFEKETKKKKVPTATLR